MSEDYRKIDMAEAAGRLHLDKAIIERLMKKFLDSDVMEKAEKAFGESNVEEARLAIHSIKGTAANLGATGLSKLALDIETKIKENGTLDSDLLKLMKEIWSELKAM
ncbi:MAG: Hpt domain-containing protein [Fibrobacter sp.]|jgi:HPt (histidine-containing phosphotransfer) domain-containing protein|nr:Hpt domain-containing protein [Fibrobacter sp.]